MEKTESDPNFTKKNALRVALAEQGWRVAAIEVLELPWWDDERWTIESIWSPQHFQVTLSFLVDPMSDDHTRRKGAGVRAISISPDGPMSGVIFDLKGEWIVELMAALNKQRGGCRN